MHLHKCRGHGRGVRNHGTRKGCHYHETPRPPDYSYHSSGRACPCHVSLPDSPPSVIRQQSLTRVGFVGEAAWEEARARRATQGSPPHSTPLPPLRTIIPLAKNLPVQNRPRLHSISYTLTFAGSLVARVADLSAWSRSSIKSSSVSRPTERRMKSGVTPVSNCSPGVSCECVVLAG